MIHFGVIEDRLSDPLQIGRVKVRVVGVHTPNRTELPTADLPWATVMMPVSSASIDGIGCSPTGLVEGSTVLVVFLDTDKQLPVVLGSIPTVPTQSADPRSDTSDPSVLTYKPSKPINQDAWATSDGSILQDSAGNPITNQYGSIGALTISEAGLNAIRESEALASLVRGGYKLGNNRTAADTPVYAYRDTRGIWTIGWGSTYLADGSKVTENTVMTKAQADSLMLATIDNTFARDIKRELGVPVTQAMFDVLVSMAYNMGSYGLRTTDFWRELNKGYYKIAADLIPATKTNNGTLTPRRVKERSMFLSEGIPAYIKVDR